MPLFSWLHRRMTGQPQTRPASAHVPTLRFRPQIEAIEGRDVPSTLTVTNNLDDGAVGSLGYEIGAAESGDTIVFSPSMNGQTISLTNGELGGANQILLNKNLNIEGPGATQLFIAGAGSRVFEVAAGVQVTLSGLSIVDGSGYLNDLGTDKFDGLGGGILNFGTLTLNGCVLAENSIGNGTYGEGGGIFNAGTLTVNNCNLGVNTAFEGGAIGNVGTLTVSGCSFSLNSAVNGGAIFNGVSDDVVGMTGPGVMSVSGCSFSSNYAAMLRNSSPTDGGGIYNGAKATATIANCTFSGDTASDGGGIYNAAKATMTVKSCTLSGDIAASDGGGIYNDGKLTVSNSFFSDNTPDDIFGSYTDKGGNTFE